MIGARRNGVAYQRKTAEKFMLAAVCKDIALAVFADGKLGSLYGVYGHSRGGETQPEIGCQLGSSHKQCFVVAYKVDVF